MQFSAPFALRGIDEPLPPGEYAIDQDEHLIEGMTWLAYRRIATFIHLPALSERATTEQLVEIDAYELEAALKQDLEQQYRA
ncbi:hypothetical protein [Pseudaminobacter sp. NGMCC 1.201702]|uniref:hypothetical protein n=1 Tax=Pseudaminobacter sp. NGMCC 1.201702 TaxID=3391825 RepID=UPI0039EF4B09